MSFATDALIIGDTQLKPVVETISGITEVFRGTTKTYSLADIKGKLSEVVGQETAKVVIPLGKDELEVAMTLPASIPVIYGLVVMPPPVARANMTGFYMATPIQAYIDLLKNHLPTVRKVAVIGGLEQFGVLDRRESARVVPYMVKTSVELVDTVRRIDAVNAILLLPYVSVLTDTAMGEAFLLSFRKMIPLLGIAERHVARGALLALVFDPLGLGRQIGVVAQKAATESHVETSGASAADKFDLYINKETAGKMGIALPDELLKKAKKVYP